MDNQFPSNPNTSKEPLPEKQIDNSPEVPESDEHSTANYSSYIPTVPHKPKSPRRRILMIVPIVLVLGAAIGGGAYWYLKHHKTAKPAAQTSAPTQSTTPIPSGATTNSAGTKHYVSTRKDLNLEFDYPTAWQVSPAQSTGEGSDQPITLNSPSTTVTDSGGTSALGKVTVLIRPRSAGLSELSSTSGTAAQDSVQIGYTHPTANQHQYPYLSFIHLSSGTANTQTTPAPTTTTTTSKPLSFEEVIITGIQQFKKGSSVSSADVAELDPIVSASFYRCATTDCKDKGSGSLSITDTTWQNADLFKQVLNIFQSLKIN